jgi:short-chain Z-isoprenyl diphosphate synthase
VDAVRSIITQYDQTGGSLEDLAESLTPEQIGEHLYTGGQPDPDLVIRTSGEQRLSDFLLWQSAHSEFYFVEALGPDLREVDLLRAIRDYARRDRRFGK